MYIKSIFITTVVLLTLDAIWLGYIAKAWYSSGLSAVMQDNSGQSQVNYYAAAGTYILLILGITLFVIPKAAGSSLAALCWGAAFGFICYGVYDFTNMAIISQWPLWISIIDIVWGSVVCGLSSFITVWITSNIL